MGQCMMPVGGTKIDFLQGFYGQGTTSTYTPPAKAPRAISISSGQYALYTNSDSYTISRNGGTYSYTDLSGKRCLLIFPYRGLSLLTNETTTWDYKGYTVTSSPVITDSGQVQLNNVCNTKTDISWGYNVPIDNDCMIVVPLE